MFGFSIELGYFIEIHLASVGVELKLRPFLIASRKIHLSLLLPRLHYRRSHQVLPQKGLRLHEFLLVGILIVEELERDGPVIGSLPFFGKINGVKLLQKGVFSLNTVPARLQQLRTKSPRLLTGRFLVIVVP